MPPLSPDAADVLAALDRVRRRATPDEALDEACAAVVGWGHWRRAAFLAPSAGGVALGTSGLPAPERERALAAGRSLGAESRRDSWRKTLADFRVASGIDAAFVPAERRDGLPPPLASGPAAEGSPGERWESGDECLVVPSRDDGVPLGLLSLHEPAHGRRPTRAADHEHLRLLSAFAAVAAEIVQARLAEGVARDETRGLLSLVEDLNAIESMQRLMDRLAETAAGLGGWRVAVLSVYLPDGALLGGWNLSTDERERFRRSMANTALERRLAKRDRIRAFAFPGTSIAYVPHTAVLARGPAFTPSTAPSGGTWHPEDRLFILVKTGTGKEIGVLSLDEPEDGNAPTSATLSRLLVVERFLGLGASLLYGRVLAHDLHRTDEAYHALVDGAPVGIWRRSEDGRILSANPRLAEIFGYPSPADLTSDPAFQKRFDAEDLARATRRMEETGVARDVEVRAVRIDGRPIRLRLAARVHPERRETLGIVEDVTEARRLEEHLERTQRIEALGTLASGIAHDFNNLLAGILGYSALLAPRLEQAPALAAMAHAIEESARRAADLTRQLLGVARPARGEVARVDVWRAVSDAARVCRETFDRRIVTEVVVGDDVPAAIVDPGELNRALLNLCINARDAMPQGGVLRLAAEADREGPHAVDVRAGPAGWVRLEVEDTGVGMDEEVKARLFQPFFTTKPRGKGTGLGLYSVYQVATAFGGAVEVDSSPGHGTRFRLYLPAAPKGQEAEPVVDGAAPTPPPAPESEEDPGGPIRRVLVVEDEEPLRRLASQVLRMEGFEAVEAADGEEALQQFSAAPASFDAVLLDLVLPIVSGQEVFRRLKAVRPDLPVVLSSGNVYEGLDDPDLKAGVAAVLPKPYLPSDLVSTLRRVFSRRRVRS